MLPNAAGAPKPNDGQPHPEIDILRPRLRWFGGRGEWLDAEGEEEREVNFHGETVWPFVVR